MITASDIREKNFKLGKGYDKKEVDSFLFDIALQQEKMLSEITSLKDKYTTLAEALTYYKELEKSLQKTMVVAQKVADDTIDNANKKAEAIESIAKSEGMKIISNANNEYMEVRNKTISLIHQYENYRAQFKRLAMVQFDLINDKSFDISIANLKSDADKLAVDVDFDKLYEEYKGKPVIDNSTAKEISHEKSTSSSDEAFEQIDSAFNDVLSQILTVPARNKSEEPVKPAEIISTKSEPVLKQESNIEVAVKEVVKEDEKKDDLNLESTDDTPIKIVHRKDNSKKKISTPKNDEPLVAPVKKIEMDSIPEKKENNASSSDLNLGVVFNENNENDNLFSLDEDTISSEQPSKATDDEFIFDDNSDDESVGISFDFLDK